MFSRSTSSAKGENTVSEEIVDFAATAAFEGLAKSARKFIVQESPVPFHDDLRPKKVDSFAKKFLKRKRANFNPSVDRRQLNLAGRILDLISPLSLLWQTALSAQSENTGIDPAVVVEAIQRAISLIGKASHCALVDRRKGLLAKLSPETLDLIDDPALFAPGTPDLFGKKFKKAVFKDLKLSKEMDSLISTRRHGNGRKQFKPFQPFRQQPGKGPGYNPRATIPGHGVNADGPQGKIVGGFLNKEGKQISSSTKGNKAKRYFTRHFFKPNGPETGPTCSTNSCFQSFKNRFSVNRRACRLSRPFKTFSTQLAEITVDPTILDLVRGYKLEFLSRPIQEYIRNPLQFLHAESEKMDSEVATLLERGALNMVKPVSGQFLSSLFLVPKRDGSSRPVIDLKELNVFLKYDHFKMEGIHLLRDLLQPQDWLGKIDLKDAYFVIPVWKDHRKYLRFVWKGSLLEFACLPFGLTAAPRLFTKVLKPVVALLRRARVRLIIYLDDLLFMNQSKDGLGLDMATARYLLENLGFVINLEKSSFVPTQNMEFLGFVVNTQAMTLLLPNSKVESIKSHCNYLLALPEVSVRDLSQLIGKLTASIQAIFPAPLHYRHLQHLKHQALHYERVTMQQYLCR